MRTFVLCLLLGCVHYEIEDTSASEGEAEGEPAEGEGEGEGEPDLDADDDGYPASEDCDDALPEVHPGASEACDDGRDNDCDGLLDCEDDACETEAVCVGETDCDDGLDEDSDGYTDCDDDDCWSKACHTTRARVLGGSMRAKIVHNGLAVADDSGCGDERNSSFTRAWGTAVDVTGTVQVWSSAASTWRTCDWSVDTVELYWMHRDWERVRRSTFTTPSDGTGCRATTSSYAVTSWAEPARAGFHVDSGCDVSGSWFLPDRLKISDARLARGWKTQDGQPWYQGDRSITYRSTWADGSDWKNSFLIHTFDVGGTYSLP